MSEAAWIDRRVEPRAPVSDRVRVFYGPNLGSWWDATMRDVSASGLKLEIPALVPLPKALTVLHVPDGQVFIVRAKWRNHDMVGCKINQKHSLETEADPAFAQIKAAWLSLKT